MSPENFGGPGESQAESSSRSDESEIEQSQDYDCGPACFREALRLLNISQPPSGVVSRLLETTPATGTDLESFDNVAEEFGLEVIRAHEGSIEDIQKLLSQGYAVIVEYTLPAVDEGGVVDEGHFGIVKEIGGEKIRLWQPYSDFERNPEYRLEDFEKLWKEGPRYHGKYGGYVAFRKKERPGAVASS